MSGCMHSARAIATRCFWPPESCAGPSVRLLGQVDPLKQREGSLLDLVGRPLLQLERGQHDVLQDGLVREQVEVLEDHPDALADLVKVGVLGDQIHAVDDHVSGRDVLELVEAAQQGGLAGTRGADDRDHFPFFDIEIDLAEHDLLPERLLQVAHLDDGFALIEGN